VETRNRRKICKVTLIGYARSAPISGSQRMNASLPRDQSGNSFPSKLGALSYSVVETLGGAVRRDAVKDLRRASWCAVAIARYPTRLVGSPLHSEIVSRCRLLLGEAVHVAAIVVYVGDPTAPGVTGVIPADRESLLGRGRDD
jgi:hypothetical protein